MNRDTSTSRTSPRATSLLSSPWLEAMQEKSVTVSGVSYRLDEPFFVLATQNPIEQEGTYPLPEAQLDRFMFNVKLDYPTFEEELNIVKTTTIDRNDDIKVVLTADEILNYQKVIRKLPVPENVYSYAVGLVAKTRISEGENHPYIQKYLSWGAGPRASQYLIMAAKTHAALNGKYSPDIEDVKAVAVEVLRHRIVRNYYAEAEGISTDAIIKKLLAE